VLARPQIWSFVLWQVAEVAYFFGIWAYLITVSDAAGAAGTAGAAGAGGISAGVYFATLLARFGAVLLLCGLVVRDVLQPGSDPVRRAGQDDPAGGVLDQAPDRLALRLALRAPGPPATGAGR